MHRIQLLDQHHYVAQLEQNQANIEDAKIASKVLELVLTGKNAGVEERIPMCGVPHHAVNQYIEILVKNKIIPERTYNKEKSKNNYFK